jgi:hypothetical protein
LTAAARLGGLAVVQARHTRPKEIDMTKKTKAPAAKAGKTKAKAAKAGKTGEAKRLAHAARAAKKGTTAAEIDELAAELQKSGHQVQALGGDRYGIVAPLAIAKGKRKGTPAAQAVESIEYQRALAGEYGEPITPEIHAEIMAQGAEVMAQGAAGTRPGPLLGGALHHTRDHSISKQAQAIELLKEPGGTLATVLCQMFNWQPHSLRGFVSGVLRKKLGYRVESTKAGDSNRLYRIVGGGPREPRMVATAGG